MPLQLVRVNEKGIGMIGWGRYDYVKIFLLASAFDYETAVFDGSAAASVLLAWSADDEGTDVWLPVVRLKHTCGCCCCWAYNFSAWF